VGHDPHVAGDPSGPQAPSSGNAVGFKKFPEFVYYTELINLTCIYTMTACLSRLVVWWSEFLKSGFDSRCYQIF
jgi:hypothetical protein